VFAFGWIGRSKAHPPAAVGARNVKNPIYRKIELFGHIAMGGSLLRKKDA
jgi:hypothetical protein